MARIRTVKPEFLRHELLQDLEALYPSLRPMLVFVGLWTQCDKNGVFEYKPRQLKLDILPFLDFDIASSIALLIGAGMVQLMSHGEASGKQQGSTQEATGVKVYGFIPSFQTHQRINGKEKQDPPKFPQPSDMKEYHPIPDIGEATGKQQGSNRDDGKGKEGKGKELTTTTERTKTELVFIAMFEEREQRFRELFPEHKYEVVMEGCLAHWRDKPPPMDPYETAFRWFKMEQTKQPAPSRPYQHKAQPRGITDDFAETFSSSDEEVEHDLP